MIKRSLNFTEGEVLLIDKPLNWTSFDVVGKVRNTIKAKVGHAGTLDPLATGLLILCTGKATKKIDQYMNLEKEYTGSFKLGASTPSYDAETPENATFDTSGITREAIEAAAAQLSGEIDQYPPIFSALKVKGVPLYKRARAGQEVEIKSRKVLVSEFEITAVELPDVHFRITCSKGTYIRSLAHDLGKLLNNGAYLTSLRRTRIGEFRVEDAWNLTDFISTFREPEKNQ